MNRTGYGRGVSRFAGVFLVLSTILCSYSWGAEQRLKVAATIFPLYDLLRNVAGPDVDVVLLLPPGASPHTFAPTPGTIRTLTGSAAVFAIGHGLDDWIVQMSKEAGVPRAILVDTHVPLLPQSADEAAAHGHRHVAKGAKPGADPHYWLSIPHAVFIVQRLTEALGRLDPKAKALYEQRAAAYKEQLLSTDAEIRRLLADVPRREIATFHMAFGYFAATYGLTVVAVFEPSPGKEPGPRYVENFQRQLRTHKLRVIFTEPQLSEAPLQGMLRDIGVSVYKLDPLGGTPGLESYLAMMRFNATQIAMALRQ